MEAWSGWSPTLPAPTRGVGPCPLDYLLCINTSPSCIDLSRVATIVLVGGLLWGGGCANGGGVQGREWGACGCTHAANLMAGGG